MRLFWLGEKTPPLTRYALNYTGSKPIHRYLKELEEEASMRLDDEALLSQPIKELVARLASRSQEEAQGTSTRVKAAISIRQRALRPLRRAHSRGWPGGRSAESSGIAP